MVKEETRRTGSHVTPNISRCNSLTIQHVNLFTPKAQQQPIKKSIGHVDSMTHRKVLLIAYHFPPIQGSTGTSRTIAFSRYLKDNGWDARILTIRTDAYEDTSSENEDLIPPHVRVERAWGLDTRRSLSILGRYPMILALPDRWQSWIVGGFFKGSKIIQSWRPDIIMSTYPIASAHAMAYLLQRRFRLPWVAEFRDPMLQPNYPTTRLGTMGVLQSRDPGFQQCTTCHHNN